MIFTYNLTAATREQNPRASHCDVGWWTSVGSRFLLAGHKEFAVAPTIQLRHPI